MAGVRAGSSSSSGRSGSVKYSGTLGAKLHVELLLSDSKHMFRTAMSVLYILNGNRRTLLYATLAKFSPTNDMHHTPQAAAILI